MKNAIWVTVVAILSVAIIAIGIIFFQFFVKVPTDDKTPPAILMEIMGVGDDTIVITDTEGLDEAITVSRDDILNFKAIATDNDGGVKNVELKFEVATAHGGYGVEVYNNPSDAVVGDWVPKRRVTLREMNAEIQYISYCSSKKSIDCDVILGVTASSENFHGLNSQTMTVQMIIPEND